jgi:hypothetical protein
MANVTAAADWQTAYYKSAFHLSFICGYSFIEATDETQIEHR